MKVLIVGLGAIAAKHIASLRGLDPDVEIYALRSGKTNRKVDGVTDVASLDMLPTPPDFAIISNPTSLHADAIAKVLSLGCPLFIEKPVFGATDHDDLVSKIAETGVPTYVACNLRFLECIVFLKRYLTENPGRRINEVNVYCGSYLPDWHKDTDFRKSYNALPELGGGVHIDLIHEIDYVCWLFGFPDSSTGVCRNVSSLAIEAFDYANYVLNYPGFSASVILNYYRRDRKRFIEIVFEDETWTADLIKNTVVSSTGETVYSSPRGIADTYPAQMAYFIDALKDGRKFDNDAANAYRTLKISLDYEKS